MLASSADEREFAALRAALDADDAIIGATSSADVERSKPAPDWCGWRWTRRRSGRRRPCSWAIRSGTCRRAGKAGKACIALLSGGIGRDELLDAGAAEVYDGLAELLDVAAAEHPGRTLAQ